MAKFKVVLGTCGPETIKSGVISAKDKRSALIKYYDMMGVEYDDAKVETELRYVIEHVPTPRKVKA